VSGERRGERRDARRGDKAPRETGGEKVDRWETVTALGKWSDGGFGKGGGGERERPSGGVVLLVSHGGRPGARGGCAEWQKGEEKEEDGTEGTESEEGGEGGGERERERRSCDAGASETQRPPMFKWYCECYPSRV
jgi:hypothetical protein